MHDPVFRRVFYTVCRFLVLIAYKVVFRLRATDVGNVPARGPVLLAANHQSYLDPPAIAIQVPQRHMAFVARASLFKSVFGWIIANLNAIPLKDDAGDAGAIKEVLRRLDAGQAVLIFPEGSRSRDGNVHDFKRGVALLVKRAKCPVIPVAIAGAFERWPIGQRARLTGPPVRVLYGKPIPYDLLMKDGPDAALDTIRREVIALKARLG